MDIKDLKVGDKVVIFGWDFFKSNDCVEVEGGYNVKGNNCTMFNGDMADALVGKTVTINSIDLDDPHADIEIDGFWGSSKWIKEMYKEKPAVRKAKKVDGVAAPDTARDGSKFGPIFKFMIQKFPELADLSTNKFSKLTDEEFNRIAKLFNVNIDGLNKQAQYEKVYATIYTMKK